MAKKNVDVVVEVVANGAAAEPKKFAGKATLDAELPALPDDAASKTYALQAVNGVLSWVQVVG